MLTAQNDYIYSVFKTWPSPGQNSGIFEGSVEDPTLRGQRAKALLCFIGAE